MRTASQPARYPAANHIPLASLGATLRATTIRTQGGPNSIALENVAAMHRWDDEVFHQGKVAVLDDLMVPAFIDNDAANPTGDAAGLR